MISSSFSLSINIKSHVPVLLLVILNGASKSYKISWLYQNLSSLVLNEFRDFVMLLNCVHNGFVVAMSVHVRSELLS